MCACTIIIIVIIVGKSRGSVAEIRASLHNQVQPHVYIQLNLKQPIFESSRSTKSVVFNLRKSVWNQPKTHKLCVYIPIYSYSHSHSLETKAYTLKMVDKLEKIHRLRI